MPEFMAAYPAESGWRVEREAVSAMSLQPELVQLYGAAVSAGKAPKDLGLPALPTGMLFQCRLVDPEGRVVRTASTLVQVRELDGQVAPPSGGKEWEMGETNAFQRLVAAMGFGGDQLDADETRMHGRNTVVAQAAQGPVAVIEVDDDQGQTQESVESGSSVGAEPSKPVAPVKATKAAEPDLFASFKRQLELVARQLDRDVPEVKTVADCKRELAKMLPVTKKS
ncbi:MAG: hypothetical protein BGP25_05515 [Lysobacterales bacterium 63-13]|nr:MAG: hypothetical protein BGP25_05515 [Xanthomonadales bacterium 63-13]